MLPPWLLQFAADVLVAVHAALVLFAVGGLLLTLLGGWRRWQWVRNVWFRGLHLAYVLFVAVEAALGRPCPLTEWEGQLRRLAGGAVYPGSFVGRWIHELLYVEVDPSVLNAAYVVFALAVVASWLVVPPRWSRERHGSSEGGSAPTPPPA